MRGVRVQTVAAAAVRLGWTAPDNESSAITGYTVERSEDDGATWAEQSHSGTTTTLRQGGLTDGTTYSYRVKATNANGDSVVWSETASATPAAAPAWNGIVPAEVNAGEQYRILFVTSTLGDATSADIADYNSFVQGVADAAPGNPFDGITFKALGSTEDVDARCNTQTHTAPAQCPGVTVVADAPSYYYRGEKVADDYADLYDGAWASKNAKEEDGTDQSPRPSAHTGSNSDGTAHASKYLGASSIVRAGYPYPTDRVGQELDGIDRSATNELTFYALSEVLTAGESTNSAPVFSPATATRAVDENTPAGTAIGSALPAATDVDNDPLTYSLGAADAESFDFDTSSRQLSTKTGVTYDHEARSSYTVTVTADDGNSGSADLTVNIAVTDVAEPPSAPAAPTFGAATTTSLAVNWVSPVNTGPAITDYDVRYRAGSSGSFTDAGYDGAGTSHTITGLTAGTSYQVQVRATNAEGAGLWSPSATRATPAVSALDTDADGLIEVSTLAQLNAIRWDPDGDGVPKAANAAAYAAAFPNAAMSCGATGCHGYELTTHLDFDTDGDGSTHVNGVGDADDAYYNAGNGWEPIGTSSDSFTATFEGNGRTIANLFVNRGSADYVGLFGRMGTGAAIRNVGVLDVRVAGKDSVGGLAGFLHYQSEMIANSYATGSVSGNDYVGGLVGVHSGGTIRDSYARGSVSGDDYVGGLLGFHTGEIAYSYATGRVSGDESVGGLVGGRRFGHWRIIDSYWDRQTSGIRFNPYGEEGKTTSELQAPTSASGIYSTWDAAVWDFGDSGSYPTLRATTTAPATNQAPVFPTATATRTVAENTASGQNIGAPVAATDPDTGDTLTYSLEGTDATSFVVVSTSGQLQTAAALDFETDAQYDVRVRATDGGGLTDTIDVTIVVTDVNEPPGAPAAPTFGTATTTSLAVNWVAPANTGPAITDYDVRYREGSSGSFTDAGYDGAGTAHTITGLTAETSYQVQVRATNAEGTGPWSASGTGTATTVTDYDQNDDGLVEVSTLAQLNAMRWDLDGDGDPASANAADYAAAFPNAAEGMGCGWDDPDDDPDAGATVCRGYELMADLDFDTDDDGSTHTNGVGDADDDYYNSGSGWEPIGGTSSTPFATTFEGNSRTVANLWINTPGPQGGLGLFGYASIVSEIRNIGLVNVDVGHDRSAGALVGRTGGMVKNSHATGRVYGDDDPFDISTRDAGIGGLVGEIEANGAVVDSYADVRVSGDEQVGGLVGNSLAGAISNSYSTGGVSGNTDVGGLVGRASAGTIANSYSTGSVSGGSLEGVNVGGLVGDSSASTITNSYSIASVSGNTDVGGLVGRVQAGTITASYWDTDTSGIPDDANTASPEGRTTTQLQAPTSATGIYATWDADVWDFGDAGRYPALKADTDGNGTATAAEFGDQGRDLPARVRGVSAQTTSTDAVTLTWDAPDDGGSAITGYTVERSEDDGATWTDQSHSGTTVTLVQSGLTSGTTYLYQVKAINANGDSVVWSETASATPASTNNNPPVFSPATATRTVGENTPADTDIGAALPAAIDADNDPLTYSLGAADAESFDFDTSSRQLSTKTGVTYDHEARSSYTVTVTADDGNSGSAVLTVNIAVTDVTEPPSAPAAPTFGAATTTSLAVNWVAPANTGPAITDYDVRYRAGSSGSFTDAGYDGAGTSHTITGLTAGTSYQVQVRATNAEGTGPWSAAGTGTTPTPTNQAPQFTSGPTSRSYPENSVRVVGTYTATDPEMAPTLTWSLGGDDAGDFGIVRGVLIFDATPDFEAPTDADTDNVYEITVRVSDGSLEDTRDVTITVTDVNEAPVFPTATASRTVAENTASGQNIGAPVAATDPDAGDTLTYSLEGADAASFAIVSNSGQLRTSAALDFETDAQYEVRVTVTDGGGLTDTIDVTISVTNVNEPGTVTLSTNDPVVGTILTAGLTDPDGGVTSTTWQWESSPTGSGSWTAITGATANAYTPVSGDVGNYLRAVASYSDAQGSGQSAAGVSANPAREPNDREILMELYHATGGDNWDDNTGWGTDTPLSDWFGVNVNRDGRVTWVVLDFNSLRGEIPVELTGLTALKVLSLTGNYLRGEIPAELADFADLRHLYLDFNDLRGEIPARLGDLEELRVLKLGSNDLRGGIPSQLGNLARLRELSLSNNRLEGEIPAQLGDLTKLKELYLNDNRLEGEIPAQLGNLAELTSLYLVGNRLEGEIPAELGNLANLTTLYLSENELTGCVPDGLRDVPTNDFDELGLPFCGP